MATYGVVPTGFARKSLPLILQEIEQANREIFGPGIIQTPQSPLGQLNGLRADLIAAAWEIAEDTYQSYDPDQAEGLRLEALARLRLLERAEGETDANLAQAITNAGMARIRDADFYREILNVDGVTWAKIYTNDADVADANGLAPHSVSVAVLGGDEEAIATTARAYIVPGVASSGNRKVETTIDGFCRSIWITRPTVIPITLEVDLYKRQGANGCPPPADAVIAETILANLTGDKIPDNDADVTRHMIQMAVSCDYPNVEVSAVRAARNEDAPVPVPLAIGFYEMAGFALDRITVTAL